LSWNNGNISINFDEEPFQLLSVVGEPTTIKVINGGLGKTITLRMQNTTNFDRDLIWGTPPDDIPIFVGSLAPTEIKAGKYALVSFTSFGPDESDTIIAFGEQK
jgi:hypothetical protein